MGITARNSDFRLQILVISRFQSCIYKISGSVGPLVINGYQYIGIIIIITIIILEVLCVIKLINMCYKIYIKFQKEGSYLSA